MHAESRLRDRRWFDDLVARDLAITPPLAQAQTQSGTGGVIGAQLTVRIAGWLAYTLSRSTYLYYDPRWQTLVPPPRSDATVVVRHQRAAFRFRNSFRVGS
jgi:hypothetical protein